MNTLIGNSAALRFGRKAALILCSLVAMAPLTTLSAPSSPFVFAVDGVWEAGGATVIIPETPQISTTGPVIAEVGSLPIAYAGFRSAFGSNGFMIQVSPNMNREVYGASGWSDGFTVTSNAATGFVSLSTRIKGSVSGLGEMNYALFISDQPYDLATLNDTASTNRLGFWALSLPNAVRVMFTGVSNGCGVHNWSRECGHVPYENFQGSLDLTLSASVPFTSGQTFYVIAAFVGGVGADGGIESFLNSADFGISAPTGTTLQSLSATNYSLAVPEPSSGLLLLIGLVLAPFRSLRILRRQPLSIE